MPDQIGTTDSGFSYSGNLHATAIHRAKPDKRVRTRSEKEIKAGGMCCKFREKEQTGAQRASFAESARRIA